MADTAATWDAEVAALGGHWQQSWRWGEYRRCEGWEVERFRVATAAGTGLAQLLFRQLGPFTLARLPRGPVLGAAPPAVGDALFATIDAACRRRRALSLLVEPHPAVPGGGRWLGGRAAAPAAGHQARQTLLVPLLEDEALLGQMRKKTRYSVHLAQRRGVTVAPAAPDARALATFQALLDDTARRNRFRPRPRAALAHLLRVFADDATLLFAYVEGVAVAGEVVLHLGATAVAMLAASSSAGRVPGATALLAFEAMRHARARGGRWYDTDGVGTAPPDLVAAPDGTARLRGSSGRDMRALDRFKLGFGGDVVTYPAAVEYRYHPRLLQLALGSKRLLRTVTPLVRGG